MVGWKSIGVTLTKAHNLITPFDIMPLDDRNAIFIVDSLDCRTNILTQKKTLVNGSEVLLSPWSPNFTKPRSLGEKNVFWLMLEGVPLHLWTPEIIKTLAAQCGELLAIDPAALALEDLTGIKVKIRNTRGVNSIPREIGLKTADGEYNVLVNIAPVSPSLNSVNSQRVHITVEDDDVANISPLISGVRGLMQSACATSSLERLRGPLSYKEVVARKTYHFSEVQGTVSTEFSPRGSFCQSYPPACKRTRRHSSRHHTRRQNEKKNKKKKGKGHRSKWVWVPITKGARPCESISSNLNLELVSSHVVLSTNAQRDQQATVPFEDLPIQEDEDLDHAQGHHLLGSWIADRDHEISTPVAPIAHLVESGPSSIENLALKRLHVGIELGMTVNLNRERALTMLENSIRLDAHAMAASKIIHKDVIEDVQEVVEAGESSVVTPIAFHEEGIPLDFWLDSQLRDIFATDISNSFGIPPGFENSCPSVSLSVRQLRKKLKERFVELVSQGVDVANHLGASRKI